MRVECEEAGVKSVGETTFTSDFTSSTPSPYEKGIDLIAKPVYAAAGTGEVVKPSPHTTIKEKIMLFRDGFHELRLTAMDAVGDTSEEANNASTTASSEEIPVECLKAPDTPSCELDKYADDLAGEVPSPVKLVEESPDLQLTAPDSPEGLSDESDEEASVQVSPLRFKPGRSPRKMLAVDSKHAQNMIPRFSLVPTSMKPMLTTEPHRLEEIKETDEVEEAEAEISTAPDQKEALFLH